MRPWAMFETILGIPPPEHIPSSQPNPLPLRILSHNIRYATSSPFTNERPWSERLPLIINELSYNTRFLDGSNPAFSGASFICLQEVLHIQLVDILKSLNGIDPSNKTLVLPGGPTWAHIGVARDDGHTKGEYSPIIYPVRLFKPLHFETVWLSPTPDKPSKGWDAGSIRILTVGVFEHKKTGQRLLATCTHLDNVGGKSRKKSIPIILDTIKRVRDDWVDNQNNLPAVFLAGDFNSFPTDEAYQDLQNSGVMTDICPLSPQRYGDDITFTGFGPDKDKEEQGRIDFIWLGPKESVGQLNPHPEYHTLNQNDLPKWKVDGYAVLPNLFEDGVYSSDHRCVVGDVSLYA
ncbi:MAG: hypothetical protein M1834_000067 [Cirrosporium novae-zelandiae]|nr:MAG: hypothetical protein M1834_000067 [Cirrosporium novae-zelandiae]